MSEQVPVDDSSQYDLIVKKLERDFQVSPEHRKYLLGVVQGNLRKLEQGLKVAGSRRQWRSLQLLNRKLGALGVNLQWEALQRLCAFMEQTIEQENEQNLDRLIKKLRQLITEAFDDGRRLKKALQSELEKESSPPFSPGTGKIPEADGQPPT